MGLYHYNIFIYARSSVQIRNLKLAISDNKCNNIIIIKRTYSGSSYQEVMYGFLVAAVYAGIIAS